MTSVYKELNIADGSKLANALDALQSATGKKFKSSTKWGGKLVLSDATDKKDFEHSFRATVTPHGKDFNIHVQNLDRGPYDQLDIKVTKGGKVLTTTYANTKDEGYWTKMRNGARIDKEEAPRGTPFFSQDHVKLHLKIADKIGLKIFDGGGGH